MDVCLRAKTELLVDPFRSDPRPWADILVRIAIATRAFAGSSPRHHQFAQTYYFLDDHENCHNREAPVRNRSGPADQTGRERAGHGEKETPGSLGAFAGPCHNGVLMKTRVLLCALAL